MRRILLLSSFVLLTVITVRAQGVTTASMTGIIKDSKGEIVPGSNIVATHVPSGTTYGASSRSDGYYNLQGMRVGGPYTVKATFIGFKEQVVENVYVQLGQSFVLNFNLIDEATQLAEVVVSGVVDPTLNSDKIGASTNFNVNQIQNLPSIGRDFRDISRLTRRLGELPFHSVVAQLFTITYRLMEPQPITYLVLARCQLVNQIQHLLAWMPFRRLPFHCLHTMCARVTLPVPV